MIRAWEVAKRKAQLAGREVSPDESMAALYPEMLASRKRGIQDVGIALDREKLATQKEQFGQTLASNQDIFNQQMGFQKDMQNEARPWQYGGLAVSGIGNIGTMLYSLKQDQLYKDRLAKLLSQYKIGGA